MKRRLTKLSVVLFIAVSLFVTEDAFAQLGGFVDSFKEGVECLGNQVEDTLKFGTITDQPCGEEPDPCGDPPSWWTENWTDRLPDCPCKLNRANYPLPDKNNGGNWEIMPPEARALCRFFHRRCHSDLRWSHPDLDMGQQCIYDFNDRLINSPDPEGRDWSGTPDSTSPSKDKKKHFRDDVVPWWTTSFVCYVKWWPPNRGRDADGNECPANSGSLPPPRRPSSPPLPGNTLHHYYY